MIMLEDKITKELLKEFEETKKKSSKSKVAWEAVASFFGIAFILLLAYDPKITGYFYYPSKLDYASLNLMIVLVFVALALIFFVMYKKEVKL